MRIPTCAPAGERLSAPDRVPSPWTSSALETSTALGAYLWRWASVSRLAQPGRVGTRHEHSHDGYPRAMCDRLAAAVTAAAPGLAPDSLSLLARYGLWTVLLDNDLDRTDQHPAALWELTNRVCGIARGARPAPHDPLGTALADLLGELRRTTLARGVDGKGLLLSRMTDSLCDAVNTGAEHTLHAGQIRLGTKRPPTISAYLALASRHVNYRSFGFVHVLLIGEPVTAAATDLIDTALMRASLAIRLANDSRSVARDRLEGRLNAFTLADETRARISSAYAWRQIEAVTAHHDRLMTILDIAGAPATAAALRHSLHASLRLYRAGDIR